MKFLLIDWGLTLDDFCIKREQEKFIDACLYKEGLYLILGGPFCNSGMEIKTKKCCNGGGVYNTRNELRHRLPRV